MVVVVVAASVVVSVVAGNGVSDVLYFKNFWGSIPPYPPRNSVTNYHGSALFSPNPHPPPPPPPYEFASDGPGCK